MTRLDGMTFKFTLFYHFLTTENYCTVKYNTYVEIIEKINLQNNTFVITLEYLGYIINLKITLKTI